MFSPLLTQEERTTSQKNISFINRTNKNSR